MAPPLFKGRDVVLGHLALTLPPLSFGGIDACKDDMQRIQEGQINDPAELQAAFMRVLLAAFQRNHTDLSAADLAGVLDWSTAVQLYGQLMEITFPRPEPGESRAVTPSGASIGS